MRTDDFREALDTLAGEDPSIDDAFTRVAKKTRAHRVRKWAGAAMVSAVVVAIVTVGTVGLPEQEHHRINVIYGPAHRGFDRLDWNRVSVADAVSRIVTANGTTFIITSRQNDRSVVTSKLLRLAADGETTPVAFDTSNGERPADIAEKSGTLVVVGAAPTGSGEVGASAWYSKDGGQTWKRSHVSAPKGSEVDQVVVSDDMFYGIGAAQTNGCPSRIWTSRDGTDFQLTPPSRECTGSAIATEGPHGIVITAPQSGNAWTRSGTEWVPHRIEQKTKEASPMGFAIAADARGYVAVGSVGNDFGSQAVIWWSDDGKTWRRVQTVGTVAPSSFALFIDVAHSATGWIAVGAFGDRDEANAMVWTSEDGIHWKEMRRDADSFEKNARASAVGATAHGFAIGGIDYLTDLGLATPPASAEAHLGSGGGYDNVLWIGSASAATTTGTIAGSLQEIGGLMRGANPVAGTAVATGPDHQQHTAPVDKAGRFSIEVAPGTYTVVGHSPVYGSGKYTCRTGTGPVLVPAGGIIHVELICPIR